MISRSAITGRFVAVAEALRNPDTTMQSKRYPYIDGDMLVLVMIGLMAFHDITSIRAAKRYEGSPHVAPGNRAGSRAAALATLVAILVLYVSVRLVRG